MDKVAGKLADVVTLQFFEELAGLVVVLVEALASGQPSWELPKLIDFIRQMCGTHLLEIEITDYAMMFQLLMKVVSQWMLCEVIVKQDTIKGVAVNRNRLRDGST